MAEDSMERNRAKADSFMRQGIRKNVNKSAAPADTIIFDGRSEMVGKHYSTLNKADKVPYSAQGFNNPNKNIYGAWNFNIATLVDTLISFLHINAKIVFFSRPDTDVLSK